MSCVISVVMPVYNAEAYLAAAIESILTQTEKAFEFIIIDDASTDGSLAIIQHYAEQDTRICLVQNIENLGVTKTLNKGLSLAKGQYIARMDADDIALPRRFEKQRALMDANTEVGICGTWTKTLGTRLPVTVRFAREDWHIRVNMLLRCELASPTVMIRREVLLAHQLCFDEHFARSAEDYEFYARLLHVTKAANVPEALVRYRRHANQAVVRLAAENAQNAKQVVMALWAQQKLVLPPSLLQTLVALPFHVKRNANDLDAIAQALLQLRQLSQQQQHWSQKQQRYYCARAWLMACVKSQGLSVLSVLWCYFRGCWRFGFGGLSREDSLRFWVR